MNSTMRWILKSSRTPQTKYQNEQAFLDKSWTTWKYVQFWWGREGEQKVNTIYTYVHTICMIRQYIIENAGIVGYKFDPWKCTISRGWKVESIQMRTIQYTGFTPQCDAMQRVKTKNKREGCRHCWILLLKKCNFKVWSTISRSKNNSKAYMVYIYTQNYQICMIDIKPRDELFA